MYQLYGVSHFGTKNLRTLAFREEPPLTDTFGRTVTTLSLYGDARDEKLDGTEVGRITDGASFSERVIGITASGSLLICA